MAKSENGACRERSWKAWVKGNAQHNGNQFSLWTGNGDVLCEYTENPSPRNGNGNIPSVKGYHV